MAIAPQKARRGVPGEGPGDLASQPGLRGIGADIEADDVSSLVTADDQNLEQPKRCRYDGEHVCGGGVVPLILQERASDRGGGLRSPRQIPADAGLADHDGKLEQLAVNAGRSAWRVCLAHLADQFTDLAVRAGPP